jgi:phospholipid/cholesterol/gamma-HCH transport system ATP-binding protein
MIEVQGLSKRFGDVQVLTDINATFSKGLVNQIIGMSGSGKSVLAKCMVGLHKPEEGKVLYEGRSFHDMDTEEKRGIRQEIGMLFQGAALFDSMSVLENVMAAATGTRAQREALSRRRATRRPRVCRVSGRR